MDQPRSFFKSPSGIVSLVSIFILFLVILLYPLNNPLAWDVFGYYLYLPQTIIYSDPGLHDISTVHEIMQQYHLPGTFYQAHPTANGTHIIQYPIGMAVLYLPFFLIGHLFAWLGGYPTDGFSVPYQYAFHAGYLFYLVLAILLARKVLLHFFSEKITCITLVLLIAGTNFYSIVVCSPGMPHLYLFVLFAALLLVSIRWHTTHRKKDAVFIGLLLGLMCLCRPTEILAVLIPLLYGVQRLREIPQRITLFFTTYRIHALWVILVMFLIILPQLIYWKVYTGEFLYNSYRNPGEGFDFLSPHTWNFLFSFRKGWFIYTPVMLVAVVGCVWLLRKKHPLGIAASTFVILNVYVLSSWSCWWYAASFSQRPVVQSYPLLIVGLAASVHFISEHKKAVKWILSALGLFFIWLNLFQTWQINNGILDAYRMTPSYYVAIFGATHKPSNAEELLLVNREFTDDQQFTDSLGYKGKWIYTRENEECITSFDFSSNIEIPFNEITQTDHAWLRIEGELWMDDPVTACKPSLIRSFSVRKGVEYAYQGVDLEKTNPTLENKKWVKFSTTYLTPEVRSTRDKFTFYILRRGTKTKICWRNVRIRAYERMSGK